MRIEAVDGLANACDHMKKIADEKPGHYFVCSASTHTVLAEVDTGSESQINRREQGRHS
jgi:hypothetical protein